MPEGDSLHRAARRLQALVGRRVEVETPHPRAAALGLAERLDGRQLESVEAIGKNFLLTFEGGLVVRSHLRMSGRWQVRRRDSRPQPGLPWLVLRPSTTRLSSGTDQCSSSPAGRSGASGPTSSEIRPTSSAWSRTCGTSIPGARSETRCWTSDSSRGSATSGARRRSGTRASLPGSVSRTSPTPSSRTWSPRLRGSCAPPSTVASRNAPYRPSQPGSRDGDCPYRTALRTESRTVTGRPRERAVYRRTGRPCPRCGVPIHSRGQGDDNRTAYWCPGCQRGEVPPEA